MADEEDRVFAALRGPGAGTDRQLDAPFWPTHPPLVDLMLDMAAVGPGDHLYDLGCGDGRIVIAAARRGARATGIDVDAIRIAEAEAAARAAGVEALVDFRREDLFVTRLEPASVVTLYLSSLPNRLLTPRLRSELRPGSRVVSNSFDLPGWPPTRREVVDYREIRLWVVP